MVKAYAQGSTNKHKELLKPQTNNTNMSFKQERNSVKNPDTKNVCTMSS